jgi:adenylate cyclase
VPEARFLAASIANTRTAATVGLVVLLAAIGLGWLVAERVARPLRRITGDLEQVGRFNLSREPAPTSFVHEITVVSNSVDRMKTNLRSFGHYVPVDLVREVIASGEEAHLRVETRELTLLFSDIAGFTTISEHVAPNALVAQLAEYLEAMTGAIRAEGGTIDKYIGDGIVAFFNAPRLLPTHAAAACRAALAAQAALLVLQARWAAVGQPAFPTRIGLKTWEVLVGNIGTPERFAYTAMGDAMNLASRLESLNKAYGTAILVSEDVRTAAESGFEWRRLDRVAVVGRQQGTLVFELLGEAGRLPQGVLLARDRYETALDTYFMGRFAEAAAGFAEAGLLRPGDRAVDVMVQRARQLAQNPPGLEWDGVFVSLQK